MEQTRQDAMNIHLTKINEVLVKLMLINAVLENPSAHKGIPEAVLQAAVKASRELKDLLKTLYDDLKRLIDVS